MNSQEPAQPSLGYFVGLVRKASEEFAFYAEADAGFDAGEFSGPAIARAEQTAFDLIARDAGFSSYDALLTAVQLRTSYRWAHFNLPPARASEEGF